MNCHFTALLLLQIVRMKMMGGGELFLHVSGSVLMAGMSVLGLALSVLAFFLRLINLYNVLHLY